MTVVYNQNEQNRQISFTALNAFNDGTATVVFQGYTLNPSASYSYPNLQGKVLTERLEIYFEENGVKSLRINYY